MLIYVEGIDKAGKTTLINQLSPTLNVPFYRKHPPNTLVETEYHSYFKGIGYSLIELHTLLTFDLIIDRSFISDWVYSNKNAIKVDLSVWQEWENRQKDTQSTVVFYVSISYNEFLSRITREPDPYMKVEDYPRFVQLYEEYLASTKLPVVRISGNLQFSSQLRQIQEWARSVSLPIGNHLLHLINAVSSVEGINNDQ